MKKVIILLFLQNVFSTSFVRAVDLKLEIGKWNFVKDKDYCYIGSLPIFLDIPEGKNSLLIPIFFPIKPILFINFPIF